MSLGGAVARHSWPASWPEMELRHCVAQRKEFGAPDLPLLGVGLVSGVRVRADDDGRPAASDDLSGYKVVNPDDLVMNALGKPHGSIGRSPVHGITSPAYWVLQPQLGFEARYLHHLLRSSMLLAEYNRLGKYLPPNQFDISWESFRSISLPVPPLDEQRRIADFLDAQVARIDSLIERRRGQLDLMAGSRLHLLGDAARRIWGETTNRAVSWFPVHLPTWQVLRVSWIVDCLDGRRVPLNGEDRQSRQGPFPYYGASTVVDHIDDYLFDEELVLVGEDGGALANVEFDVVQEVSGKCWVNNHAHVLRARGVEPKFLADMLRCVDRPLLVSGSTRPKVTQEDLLSLRLPVPPIEDRAVLMSMAEALRGEWAPRLTALSRSIDLLEEYKRSLITAAVTGEFDMAAASGQGVPV